MSAHRGSPGRGPSVRGELAGAPGPRRWARSVRGDCEPRQSTPADPGRHMPNAHARVGGGGNTKRKHALDVRGRARSCSRRVRPFPAGVAAPGTPREEFDVSRLGADPAHGVRRGRLPELSFALVGGQCAPHPRPGILCRWCGHQQEGRLDPADDSIRGCWRHRFLMLRSGDPRASPGGSLRSFGPCSARCPT